MLATGAGPRRLGLPQEDELPGVSYAEDPVADFHRICSEGVSGKFYTHTPVSYTHLRAHET